MSWFEVEVAYNRVRVLNLNSEDNPIKHISKAISNLFIIPASNIEQFEQVPKHRDIDQVRGLHATSRLSIVGKDESIIIKHHRQITEGEIFAQLLRLYLAETFAGTKSKKQFIDDVLYGSIIHDIFLAEKTKGMIVFQSNKVDGCKGIAFVMQGTLYDNTKGLVTPLDLYNTISNILYTSEKDRQPIKSKFDGLCSFVIVETSSGTAPAIVVRDYATRAIITYVNVYMFTNGLPLYVSKTKQGIKIVSAGKKPKYFVNKPKYSVGVIALSGGLDSSCTLFEYVFTRMLTGTKFIVQPLYFDYGHRTAEAEYTKALFVIDVIRQFIDRFAEELDLDKSDFVINDLVKIDITPLSQFLSTSKSILFGDNRDTVLPDQAGTVAYVPNRNDVMLSIGTSILESLYLRYLSEYDRDDVETVLMFGANLSDGLTYKDNAPVYIQAKEKSLDKSLSRAPNLLIFCPFVNATKTTYLSNDWFVYTMTNYLQYAVDMDFDKCLKYASLYNTWKRKVAVNTLSCRYATVEKKDGNWNIITSLDRLRAGEIELTQLSGPEASRLIAFKLNGIEF